MNSCYSWQNRIVDMKLHGSLLHNSTPWCTGVAVIATSLSLSRHLSWCISSHIHDHTVCLCITLSWQQNILLNFLFCCYFVTFFTLAFLICVELASFLAFSSQRSSYYRGMLEI